MQLSKDDYINKSVHFEDVMTNDNKVNIDIFEPKKMFEN